MPALFTNVHNPTAGGATRLHVRHAETNGCRSWANSVEQVFLPHQIRPHPWPQSSHAVLRHPSRCDEWPTHVGRSGSFVFVACKIDEVVKMKVRGTKDLTESSQPPRCSARSRRMSSLP